MLRTRGEMGRLGCRACFNQFQYSHALYPFSPSAPAIRGVAQTNIVTNSSSSRWFSAQCSTRTQSRATDDIWSRKGSTGVIYSYLHAREIVGSKLPSHGVVPTNISTRAMTTGPANGHSSGLDAKSKKTTEIPGNNRSMQKKPNVAPSSANRFMGPPEDGLTRYPTLSSPQGILRGMDYMGTAVFALSGTVTAGTSGMDLLGCCIVGTITATGGGTVRDLLLGNSPVFWMNETEYLWMCLLTSASVFFVWSYLSERGIKDDMEILNWADAMGIGAFCCIGAQAGIRKGLSPIVCILCGMLTSSFGGVIRDVLCQRPPRILHSHAEIYASTALLGSTVYVGSRLAGFSPLGKITAGFFTGMGLRVLAFKTDLRLPTWVRPFEEDASARDEAETGTKGS